MSKPVLEELILQLTHKQIKEIRNELARKVQENELSHSEVDLFAKGEGPKKKKKKSSKERAEDNKLLLLFNLLTSGESRSREETTKLIYAGKVTRNALDSVRKRLLRQVQNYLFTDMVTDEEFKVGTVFGMILLAYKLAGQRARTVMSYLLDKAETMALELRLYNVLDGIYDLQEQHAPFLRLDLNEIVRKRAINDVFYDKMRKVKRALTEMQVQANEAKRSAVFPELLPVIEMALQNQKLTAEDTDNPAIQVRIMSIFRTAYMYSKSYVKLEPLLVSRYNELKAREAFGKGDRDNELSFLYMIAHVYYRTRKFDLAWEWLEKMKELLQSSVNEKHIHALKYKALYAAVCSATGKNEEAISTLKEALKSRPKSHEMTEWLNMEISLAVYYFEGKDYRACIRTLHTITGYDIDLKGEMGPEWCFKMDLIGVLAQHESGDSDYAIRLLRSIKNTYVEFLGKEEYRHAQGFLTNITRVIKNPKVVKNAEFRKELKTVVEEWQTTQGHDIQAVRFFCWLKAKMHGRDYYELLVEELAEGE